MEWPPAKEEGRRGTVVIVFVIFVASTAPLLLPRALRPAAAAAASARTAASASAAASLATSASFSCASLATSRAMAEEDGSEEEEAEAPGGRTLALFPHRP